MSAAWLLWGSAVVIALAGAGFLLGALFSDRAGGRRRCPKCWYSMEHAPSLRCPECGYAARREKQLLRTRRRRRWVAASILPLALAALLAVQPTVQRDGWTSIMPATVLLLIFQFDDSEWVLDGIQYHMTYEHTHPATGAPMYVPVQDYLWRWQWRWLAGSTLARMNTEERGAARRRYQQWLSAAGDFLADSELQENITKAFVLDMAHEHPQVRRSAALYSIDSADIEGSIERLLPLLEHEDSQSRHAAVTALRVVAIRGGQPVSPLLRALEDEHHDVRVAALAAIADLVEKNPELRDRDDIAQAVAEAKHDPSDQVRERWVRTVRHFMDGDAYHEMLRELLAGDDPAFQAGALWAISGDQALLRSFHIDVVNAIHVACAEVRAVAMLTFDYLDWDWLVKYKDSFDLDPIIDDLKHDDPFVQDAALSALNRVPREHWYPVAERLRAVHDEAEDPRVQMSIQRILYSLPDEADDEGSD